MIQSSIMQPFSQIGESYESLHQYLNHAQAMLSSVDDNQYLRLENKYKHLILKYINDYNALQKLKQIEREIPQVILSHPNVVAELRGIGQISNKLNEEKRIYDGLVLSIQEKTKQKIELEQKLKQKKQKLILDKREYMRLRKSIHEIESKENKTQNPRKYIFEKTLKTEKYNTLFHSKSCQLDLLTGFKIGIKALQKKQFKTIGADMGQVIKNIRIKRNIQQVYTRSDLKTRLSKQRLASTKCSFRKTRMSNKENGPIFHGARLQSRQSQRTTHYPDRLLNLSGVELYQMICSSKTHLQTFTSMLNDLIYKNQ